MKKLASLALAIIMMTCLSTTAFAETLKTTGTSSSEVTGSYVAGNDGNGIIYSVDIEWNGLSMTYHAEKGAVWNPDTLKYSETSPAYWEGKGTITVTNRSNTRISAVPSYTAEADYTSAGMSFSTDKLAVRSAESGTAQTGTITVTPTGSLPNMAKSATIGTITLTIAQNPDVTLEEAQELRAKIDDLYNTTPSSTRNAVDEKYPDVYQRYLEAKTELETLLDFIERGQSTVSKEQKTLNSYYNAALSGYEEIKELYDNYVPEEE